MSRSSLVSLSLGLCFLPLPAFDQGKFYNAHSRPAKATVSILALSVSVHVGSGSEEIYLAQRYAKDGSPQLIKLVDAYSAQATAIPRSVLQAQQKLRMVLEKTPDCDSLGRDFFLRSESSNIFRQDTRGVLEQASYEVIPCYSVRHDATRLAK